MEGEKAELAAKLFNLSREIYEGLSNLTARADQLKALDSNIKNFEAKIKEVNTLEEQLKSTGGSLPIDNYYSGEALKQLLIKRLLHFFNRGEGGVDRVQTMKKKKREWERLLYLYQDSLELEERPKEIIQEIENTLKFEQILKDALERLGGLPKEDESTVQSNERFQLLNEYKSGIAERAEKRQAHEQSLELSPEDLAACRGLLREMERAKRGVKYALNFIQMPLDLDQLKAFEEDLAVIDKISRELMSKGYLKEEDMEESKRESDHWREELEKINLLAEKIQPRKADIREIGVRFDQYVMELQKIITKIKEYQPDQPELETPDALFERGQNLLRLVAELQTKLINSGRYYPHHPQDKEQLADWDFETIQDLKKGLENSYYNKIAGRYK